MKKVYFSGSFDLFHIGHLKAIQEARKIADKHNAILMVGVNTDGLYRNYKEQEPLILYKYRRKVIEALKGVDMVVPQTTFEILPSLIKYDIDIYVMCKEWEGGKDKEKEYIKKKGGEWYVVSYFNMFPSTSEIKKKLGKADYKRLLKVVEGWNIKYKPEYRSYKCASCLEHIIKAWHIWFDYKNWKCEVHLCKRCGRKYGLK